jgi:hypothetical protein
MKYLVLAFSLFVSVNSFAQVDTSYPEATQYFEDQIKRSLERSSAEHAFVIKDLQAKTSEAEKKIRDSGGRFQSPSNSISVVNGQPVPDNFIDGMGAGAGLSEAFEEKAPPLLVRIVGGRAYFSEMGSVRAYSKGSTVDGFLLTRVFYESVELERNETKYKVNINW